MAHRAWQHLALALLAVAIVADGPAASEVSTQSPGIDPTPTTVRNGYRDFHFGHELMSPPTSEKPQSKLWWNDGIWWGCLWDTTASSYRVHRMDLATHTWESVGPDADNRTDAIVDVLWAPPFLYVLSHGFDSYGPFRLHSYSWDEGSQTYSLRAGFPVDIGAGESESATIAKDTTGKLWITWDDDGDVWVNRSLSDETLWGSPFRLPVQGNDTSGDISAIASFGSRIGVLWSNQKDRKVYFASHIDSNADTVWEPREEALADTSGAQVADDHLNIAVSSDGTIFAVTKTGMSNATDPRLFLLRRALAGTWTSYVVSLKEDDHTRPIVVLDDENRKIYVFAKSDQDVSGTIRMKTSDMDNIAFDSGPGEFFIRSDEDDDINNPTSTKQPLDGNMDLLVLASDEHTHHYLHNSIDLPGDGTPKPDIAVVPGSGEYGNLLVGDWSTRTFEVRNVGKLELLISATDLVGDDPDLFDIIDGGGTFSLSPGTSREVVVLLSAETLGPVSAVLRIQSNDPDEDPLDVPLFGAGVEDQLAASPDAHDYGDVLVGTSVLQAFVVENVSNTDAVVNSTALLGPAADFVAIDGGGSFVLAPGATRNVVVQFNPTSVGSRNVTLRLSRDEANFLDVPLTGTGVIPDIAVTPLSYDFGSVPYGTSATHAIRLSNEGSADLRVASVSLLNAVRGPFSIVSGAGTFTLGPGAARDVVVRFVTRAKHGRDEINDMTDDPPDERSRASKSMFAPALLDLSHTMLRIVSDDPDESPVDVALEGTGGTPVPGTIVFEGSVEGSSAESISVTTQSDVPGVESDLYLAVIATKKYKEVATVTGMGLTWSRLLVQCGGRHQTGLEIWMAIGGASSGPVTATMVEQPDGATIVVSRYAGADATPGTLVGANTLGIAGLCDGGVDGVTYAVPTSTTVGQAVLFTAVALRDKELTADPMWSRRAWVQGGSGGGAAGVVVMDRTVESPGSVMLDGSFDEAVDWAVIALEIRPNLALKHQSNPSGSIESARLIVSNTWGGRAPRIEVQSPRTSLLHAAVFDVRGRLVRTLFSGIMPAGIMRLTWDDASRGAEVPTGVYFLRARLDGHVLTQRILRVR